MGIEAGAAWALAAVAAAAGAWLIATGMLEEFFAIVRGGTTSPAPARRPFRRRSRTSAGPRTPAAAPSDDQRHD